MNGVEISDGLSEPSQSRHGLRQGDILSRQPFIIALKGVTRKAGLNMRSTIFNRSSQTIAFAGEIDLVGRTFVTVKREAIIFGLDRNATKTMYELAGGTERRALY